MRISRTFRLSPEAVKVLDSKSQKTTWLESLILNQHPMYKHLHTNPILERLDKLETDLKLFIKSEGRGTTNTGTTSQNTATDTTNWEDLL